MDKQNANICKRSLYIGPKYVQQGKRNSGAFRKMQLHKGYEEKYRSKHKGRQNSTMEENNQSFKRYLLTKKKL